MCCTWLAGNAGPKKSPKIHHLGTARHSTSRRQPNFAALNRGCYLYSAGRPSRWALAHISSFLLFATGFIIAVNINREKLRNLFWFVAFLAPTAENLAEKSRSKETLLQSFYKKYHHLFWETATEVLTVGNLVSRWYFYWTLNDAKIRISLCVV